MQNAKKTVGAAAGVVAAACVACCASLPFVAPLLAWLGLSSLGVSTFGWSLPLAGLALLAVPIFFAIRHRRSAALRRNQGAPGCKCENGCKV